MDSSVPAVLQRLEDAFSDDVDTNTLIKKEVPNTASSSAQRRRRSRIEELMDKYIPDEKTEEMAAASAAPSSAEKPAQLLADSSRVCRPWNHADFLARLHSFSKVYDWFAKPDYLSPVQAALAGWVNMGRDRLQCNVCDAYFVHDASVADIMVPPRSQIRRDYLRNLHKEDCAWKSSICEPCLANIPRYEQDAQQLAHFIVTTKNLLASNLFTQHSNLSQSQRQWLDVSSVAAAVVGTTEADELFLQALVTLITNNNDNNNNCEGQQVSAAPAALVADAAVQQLWHVLQVNNKSDDNDSINGIENSQNVATAALLALCGWEPVVFCNINSSSGSSISSIGSSSIGPLLQCALCQRRVSITGDVPCDPLRQHRPYCPWITPQNLFSSCSSTDRSHKSNWNNELNTNEKDEDNVICDGLTGWRHASQQVALRLRAAASFLAIATHHNQSMTCAATGKRPFDSSVALGTVTISNNCSYSTEVSPPTKKRQIMGKATAAGTATARTEDNQEQEPAAANIYHRIRDILNH